MSSQCSNTSSSASAPKPRGARINKQQQDGLVNFMAQHSKFAAGQLLGHSGARTKEEMWAEVAKQLNPLGGHKEPKQWETTWRDLKSKATTKAAKIRRLRNATGNKAVDIPQLTEQEKIILAVAGDHYFEGTGCPDALPEEGDLQERLAEGDTLVLEMEPHVLRIAETLHLPSVVSKITAPSILEPTEEGEETVDDPIPALPIDEPSTSQESTAPRSAAKTATPRRYVVKNPRRERIGVQLEDARNNFQTLCEQQNVSMKMLAEAALKQADAGAKQAEAALKLADAAMLQAENERRRVDLKEKNEERFLNVVEDLTKVMGAILEKLN